MHEFILSAAVLAAVFGGSAAFVGQSTGPDKSVDDVARLWTVGQIIWPDQGSNHLRCSIRVQSLVKVCKAQQSICACSFSEYSLRQLKVTDSWQRVIGLPIAAR
jgi:hypothetical protein